ncbi:unnamed protein product [Protopolystoma xenopodis]|uniref:Uncharacterized protein n=1 Tax=Protopolystoma xenopodis TaxID=117903 RepID=A0A448WX16_9PLAT|nr:unnamed protein product [Protopolystoma xenopodis]
MEARGLKIALEGAIFGQILSIRYHRQSWALWRDSHHHLALQESFKVRDRAKDVLNTAAISMVATTTASLFEPPGDAQRFDATQHSYLCGTDMHQAFSPLPRNIEEVVIALSQETGLDLKRVFKVYFFFGLK